MHIASVGISKVCFLCSLALCGLLFLLIPALKPPLQQVDWPRPRAQARPPRPHPPDGPAVTAAVHRNAESTAAAARTQEASDETERTEGENQVLKRSGNLKGKTGGLVRPRGQDLLLLEDIFIAVKTTRKYHMSRLELLMKTWISQAREHVRSSSIMFSCPSWRLSLRFSHQEGP